MGLEAEHAFLPALLEASRNPKIQRDMPGYVDCSVYVTPLEVPTRLDRSLGDVHPMGNPHFNLDPGQARNIVRAIVEGLSRNTPEHAAAFQKNGHAYVAKVEEAMARWQREAAPLKGKKFVSLSPRPDLLRRTIRDGCSSARSRSAPASIPRRRTSPT